VLLSFCYIGQEAGDRACTRCPGLPPLDLQQPAGQQPPAATSPAVRRASAYISVATKNPPVPGYGLPGKGAFHGSAQHRGRLGVHAGHPF
jgi:hypothetical protein